MCIRDRHHSPELGANRPKAPSGWTCPRRPTPQRCSGFPHRDSPFRLALIHPETDPAADPDPLLLLPALLLPALLLLRLFPLVLIFGGTIHIQADHPGLLPGRQNLDAGRIALGTGLMQGHDVSTPRQRIRLLTLRIPLAAHKALTLLTADHPEIVLPTGGARPLYAVLCDAFPYLVGHLLLVLLQRPIGLTQKLARGLHYLVPGAVTYGDGVHILLQLAGHLRGRNVRSILL